MSQRQGGDELSQAGDYTLADGGLRDDMIRPERGDSEVTWLVRVSVLAESRAPTSLENSVRTLGSESSAHCSHRVAAAWTV